MAKDLAIVLNNGSLNSAVAAALANQKYRLIMLHSEIAPLNLAYEPIELTPEHEGQVRVLAEFVEVVGPAPEA